MNKRNGLNLVLLLIVVALALVAWLEPGKKPPPPPVHLTDLKPAQVTTIRVEQPGTAPMVLKRHGKRWRMTAPVAIAANDARVQQLLQLTTADSLGHDPIAGLDLKQYGLAKPKIKLFFNETEIDFGSETPLDHRRYVRVGTTLHRIFDANYYVLTGGFTNYLSTRLLPEGSEITALKLPDLTLTQKAGHWTPQPKPANFSADQVAKLLRNWRYADALSARPYHGSANGPAIEIQFKNHKPLHFIVLARDPDLLLARPDLHLRYDLPSEQAKTLLTLPANEPTTKGTTGGNAGGAAHH